MTDWLTGWRRLFADESGTTTVEYCVVLFLIITACIVGISALGGSNNGLWGRTSNELQGFL